ncbi:MAG: hypothetical protein B7Y25_01965 [Alphaproteobacteria bacterium 16-39-46]|nr:MAG: hypothetical protein B7Y25_01965 [Alphaproteobacteria bacterium 16-39-46]OZA43744.1 MAG: hypothetical protein B7X84_02215 [Alphaproteobacteria bacterium 17-39-52]HQS83561.1 phospholipase D-like domain-containing protein [Alphaproteobacteria bacterium]HQS93340.1 phospholipase D-like domain-containing protein [Alphaproteobacteria bacterium]
MKYLRILTFFFVSMILLSGHTYASGPKDLHWKKNQVFVFPNVGRTPWLNAINAAKKEINIAAYRLSDPQIIVALERAVKKGVTINLLIQPEPMKHEQCLNIENPIDLLKQKGVNVYTLSRRFSQAHYKLIIIDDMIGMISTGNLDTESFEGVPSEKIQACRDFAIPILDQHTLKNMRSMFFADIKDKRRVPESSKLVWGPDQQRTTFLRLINGAKKSIYIYQQDFQDVGIAEAVAGAARAGVDVRLIMMPFPFSKTEDRNIPNQTLMAKSGVKISLNEELYIHTKVLIIDEKIMYVGSGNFYTPSLDQARELGVLTKDLTQITTVLKVFKEDWENGSLFVPSPSEESK